MPTPPFTYRIHTLGCRVNHAETRDLEAVLCRYGLHRAPGLTAATVEVVHSCAVTSRAAAKSRNAARRATRRQRDQHHASTPPSLVLMTGCLPDNDQTRTSIAAGGDDCLIPHAADTPMLNRFEARLRTWLTTVDTPALEPAGKRLPMRLQQADGLAKASDSTPHRPGGHVRAELKIQDGCDAHCTFCIIPSLRPTVRSKSLGDVVDEARQLIDAGHVELVLTGIFIGAYGHETALRRKQVNRHASPLADLIDAVAAVPGLERLRLSSMEPGDVDEPLLDAMLAHDGIVVPHLHLPLQSGSDPILRRMNRQYDTAAYGNMLDMVQAALTVDGVPPALTTDIICGFPGETDDDFQATMTMAQRAGYLHMHVFPYSARQGTAAARWRKLAVHGDVVRLRVRQLIDLETRSGGLSERFRQHLLGQPLRVILEQADAARPGRWLGRCDHYAMVSVAPEGANASICRPGALVHAVAHQIEDDVMLATLAATCVSLPQHPDRGMDA